MTGIEDRFGSDSIGSDTFGKDDMDDFYRAVAKHPEFLGEHPEFTRVWAGKTANELADNLGAAEYMLGKDGKLTPVRDRKAGNYLLLTEQDVINTAHAASIMQSDFRFSDGEKIYSAPVCNEEEKLGLFGKIANYWRTHVVGPFAEKHPKAHSFARKARVYLVAGLTLGAVVAMSGCTGNQPSHDSGGTQKEKTFHPTYKELLDAGMRVNEDGQYDFEDYEEGDMALFNDKVDKVRKTDGSYGYDFAFESKPGFWATFASTSLSNFTKGEEVTGAIRVTVIPWTYKAETGRYDETLDDPNDYRDNNLEKGYKEFVGRY